METVLGWAKKWLAPIGIRLGRSADRVWALQHLTTEFESTESPAMRGRAGAPSPPTDDGSNAEGITNRLNMKTLVELGGIEPPTS